jgi:hypothetical protein
MGIFTFLCLVEAKRCRTDRKIAVDLSALYFVRTLYGALYDYDANTAMMVTSSSDSKLNHHGLQ